MEISGWPGGQLKVLAPRPAKDWLKARTSKDRGIAGKA